MIYSHPKKIFVWGIGGFVSICLLSILWLARQILLGGSLLYLVMFICILMLLTLVIAKSVLSYKKLWIDGRKLRVHYPFRPCQKIYDLSTELSHWKPDGVKGSGRDYRLLLLYMADGYRISLSNQEDSGYEQVRLYLEKKHRAKKR